MVAVKSSQRLTKAICHGGTVDIYFLYFGVPPRHIARRCGQFFRTMRQLTILFFLIFLATNLHGQIVIELYFKNDCDNSIVRLEFELIDLNNILDDYESKHGIATLQDTGAYLLTSHYEWGDKVGSFSQAIQVNSFDGLVDTINIPKIKFTTERALHSKYWNYFNCNNLCDGIERDFHRNGQKRLEGEFKKGKPSYLIEYRNDGTKETESWYVSGTTLYKRIEYFDKTGTLLAYDKYRNRKRKTIVTSYNAQGREVRQETIVNGIEK